MAGRVQLDARPKLAVCVLRWLAVEPRRADHPVRLPWRYRGRYSRGNLRCVHHGVYRMASRMARTDQSQRLRRSRCRRPDRRIGRRRGVRRRHDRLQPRRRRLARACLPLFAGMPGRLDRDRGRDAAAARRGCAGRSAGRSASWRSDRRRAAKAATPARSSASCGSVLKGSNVVIINRGVSGELSANAAIRIKNEVALTNPDLVIWQVGTDDALAFVPVEELRYTVEKTVRWLKEHNVDVVLAGLQYRRPAVAGRALLCRARNAARGRGQGKRDDHPPLRGDAVHRCRAAGGRRLRPGRIRAHRGRLQLPCAISRQRHHASAHSARA